MRHKIGSSISDRPSFDETLAKVKKASMSKYPELRLLGKGYKELWMTEEEREVNFHIIGGSRQGKSKYLEYHIRRDIDMGLEYIDRGFGLCLIDPSDYGATYNAVLDYCISINHPKVCIIDPNTLYDYGSVACIQPLNAKYATKSAHSVKDSINMLLGTSEANTQRIQENLDALLRMLAYEGLTLNEASYFVDYEKGDWKGILDNSKGSDAQIIREKFKTYAYWKSEFTTTITRLGKFRTEPLSLMIAGTPGIDFVKMVEEGWVILCNLFPEPYLTPETSTFLGILIISQIIQAVDTLKRKYRDNWKKKFYLYIDEAGSFATPQIEFLLNNKSKSGLHLIFAHHNFDQFANQGKVLSAITHNTGIKVMFALRDYEDRMKMMKLMTFDDPKAASQKYSNLPKQTAVIKKNKEHAMEVVTPTVNSVYVTDSARETYIRERLQDPWYLAKYEIEEQIKSRIKRIEDEPTRPDTSLPVGRTIPDSQTTSSAKKTNRKSLFDLGSEAEQFIRDNKTSKGNDTGQPD